MSYFFHKAAKGRVRLSGKCFPYNPESTMVLGPKPVHSTATETKLIGQV